jgi:hypothetical protein
MRKNHPKSIKSDVSKLDHINTYGDLPSHYSTPSYVAHAEKKKYGKLKIRNGITKNQKDTSMRKQFIAIHADNLGVAATNLKTTPNKTD